MRLFILGVLLVLVTNVLVPTDAHNIWMPRACLCKPGTTQLSLLVQAFTHIVSTGTSLMPSMPTIAGMCNCLEYDM